MSTPFWVAGKPASGPDTAVIRSPYDNSVAGEHDLPGADDVERAVQAAADVSAETAALPAHVRADALDHVSRSLADRSDEIAGLITAESGKPLKWSRVEVNRAVSTFRWAAEEARRFSPKMQRLDTDPGGVGRTAMIRRVPRGPVLGITPFNFPLNLVAHKVAPAIAVGAPIVLKPAPGTPLTALALGEILSGTDLP
ncbi:MAG: aldehyde dehydrogenase, partial [Pseudonocardia sp.]|nr:aldehyde dehydrogenase [Pseudonocardia sp.]